MTDTNTRGIETVYAGTRFRSRLEARWAAFFDRIDWKWTYEPFDAAGYIPDFAIHGPQPLLVEVKPAVTEDEYWGPLGRVEVAVKGHWAHDILILGADPLSSLPNLEGEYHWPPAGLLGEYRPGADGENFDVNFDEPEPGWGVAVGHWFFCDKCGEVGIFHSLFSFHGRPCGHYDGDRYRGFIAPGIIQHCWAEATNAVRWKP